MKEFFDLVDKYPEILGKEILVKISTFLLYAPRFKHDILLAQPSDWPANDAPLFLPESVVRLLSRLCCVDEAFTNELWSHLKDSIWGHAERAKEIDERYQLFGKDLGYGKLGSCSPTPCIYVLVASMYPPVKYCTNEHCKSQARQKELKLQKTDQTRVLLYTLSEGVCPAWAIRHQCEACGTAYYHNYFVKDGMRHYYEGDLPAVIQVSEHRYIERRIVDMWCTDLNIAWKSFTNCARTFEASFSTGRLPPDWPVAGELKGDHVQDGFIILSLLNDCRRRDTVLIVPHTGEQSERFIQAIKARNARIKLYGLQEITHRCKKCTRIYTDAAGNPVKSVWVVVMDGITLGYPCCAVHNCKIPLITSRDRYCPTHCNLNNVCAIKGCNAPVASGKKTCTEPSHQEVERMHTLRGESRVLLQERLQRQRVSHPNDGLPQDVDRGDLVDDEEEEEFELDEEVIHGSTEGVSDPRGASSLPSGAASTGPKKLSAQFGRKRTHNEQVLVAPCGAILARETFFGAEAISSCAEFIKRTFSINDQKPNHIFFDNNCSLAKHIKDDAFFNDIGLTVDVFHFKCKHSTGDKFCQANCNPVMFPELLGENSKAWYFNSSIAEQTNVWLGGFHAILREMMTDRYNFFLDEMILLRNQRTLAKLEKDGLLFKDSTNK